MTPYLAPDNRAPYRQGRADQRRGDLFAGLCCVIAALIVVFLGS